MKLRKAIFDLAGHVAALIAQATLIVLMAAVFYGVMTGLVVLVKMLLR